MPTSADEVTTVRIKKSTLARLKLVKLKRESKLKRELTMDELLNIIK